MTTKLTAGDIIQVEDNDGNIFEGELQIPNLDNKSFENVKTTVIKIKPDVVQQRELATYFTTTVTDAEMVAIDAKVLPLYEALRSISVQPNIDRDERARTEIYRFLNEIRGNMETLVNNKEE